MEGITRVLAGSHQGAGNVRTRPANRSPLTDRLARELIRRPIRSR